MDHGANTGRRPWQIELIVRMMVRDERVANQPALNHTAVSSIGVGPESTHIIARDWLWSRG